MDPDRTGFLLLNNHLYERYVVHLNNDGGRHRRKMSVKEV